MKRSLLVAATFGLSAALGLTPAAPHAHADGIEDVLDIVLAPFVDSANSIDWDAMASPAAWDAFFDPAHWDAVFQQAIYLPLHAGIEDWINSVPGQQFGGFVNELLGSYAIGDGTAGTAADPDGGNGGWLLGDGGVGYNGGDGGDAAWFGNGGAGGEGGPGMAGGDGGEGGWWIGNGGNGGDAGDNPVEGALPALGGAGGDGGMIGTHGAVGHFGTVAGATVPVPGGLTTTEGWITDDDGRVVILHGLNQVYKIPPYTPSSDGFDDEDAAFLAANGFNVVRLGVIWAGVEPQPGEFDQAYLDSIEQTVQTLANHNIHVILDFHQDLYNEEFQGEGAPDWAVQDGGLSNPALGFPTNYVFNPAQNHAWDAFWDNAKASDGIGLQNHYAMAWEYVANHFKDNSSIAGYELMNEPWPGSQFLPSLLGSGHFEAQQLTPFYNQLTSAIRAVDPDTPVYFEPSVMFNWTVPTQLGTIDDDHTVFAFHNYCLFNAAFGIDFGCAFTDNIILGNAADYTEAQGIPGLMTEFGATDKANVIATMLGQTNPYQFGWTEWAYTGHDITSSDPNGQALVFDPSQPPVGDNVDMDKLATLAEPYPQLVSGTPTGWSFTNGTFNFSYSTEMASGTGNFADGSHTQISVPAVEYPHGYTVTVTGGHVVSAANAPVLVIASDTGAGSVNVVVSAASH